MALQGQDFHSFPQLDLVSFFLLTQAQTRGRGNKAKRAGMSAQQSSFESQQCLGQLAPGWGGENRRGEAALIQRFQGSSIIAVHLAACRSLILDLCGSPLEPLIPWLASSCKRPCLQMLCTARYLVECISLGREQARSSPGSFPLSACKCC